MYACAVELRMQLSARVTPQVRQLARRVHSVDAPGIKFGEMIATLSVIESLDEVFGPILANAVYRGRLLPLEPDRGTLWRRCRDRSDYAEAQESSALIDAMLKNERSALIGEALKNSHGKNRVFFQIMKDWKAQSREDCDRAIAGLRFDGVDFSEVYARTVREADAVLEKEGAFSATNTHAGLGRRSRRPKGWWYSEALGLLITNPTWSDSMIAEKLGINQSQLSRYEPWGKFRAIMQPDEGNVRKGFKRNGVADGPSHSFDHDRLAED